MLHMRNIEVLDCTLRDGAQVNAARFGHQAVVDIVQWLTDAQIELIEIGYLKDTEFEKGRTYFTCTEDMEAYVPENKQNSSYTTLLDCHKYDLNRLRDYDGRTIDVIRASFFEKDVNNVYDYCKAIMDKGYRLSVQPMDTFSYTDESLKDLFALVNKLQPETMSIVDTYGVSTPDTAERLYKLVDAELDPEIKIGFHSHNNMMNSFALMKRVLKTREDDRKLIVDSSLFGMGRGAGNLNTEIVTEQFNKEGHRPYNTKPILDAIDTYVSEFKKEYEWGYSLPMMYAGLLGVHVNTVYYLLKKPGMTSYDLKEIFMTLDPHKRKRYDYDYLDEMYEKYMNNKKA